MKNYFQEFRPFILFLLKFFFCYVVLTFFYNLYLNQFDLNNFEIDDFTILVAHQTQDFISIFDSNVRLETNLFEPSVNLFFHNKWVSRIIEGCNALSVMILFVSFVVAFTGKLKNTLVFVFFGLIIIHIFNVFRIAMLVIAMYYHPEYQHFLHNIVFPLIIYGTVFLLWIIWVNKFSNHAAKI